MVEGYTDVIALHQGGLPLAVATCGTALSEGHFRLLSRFARRAVLAFDSDEAGARAAERAHGFFEDHPVEISVLVLPQDLDPADFIRERGAEEFRALAERGVPLVEYMLRRSLRGRDLETPEGRTRAVQAALPVVAGLEDPVRRDQYGGLLAELAGASASSVQLELERARRPAGRGRHAEEPPAMRVPSREVEKEALKLLVQHADISRRHVETLDEVHFTTERFRRAFAFLREHPDDPVSRAEDPALAQLVAELAVEPVRGDAAPEYADRVFSRLQELFLTRQIGTMKKQLERLNPTKDPSAYDSMFEELIALEGERRRVRARAGEGA